MKKGAGTWQAPEEFDQTKKANYTGYPVNRSFRMCSLATKTVGKYTRRSNGKLGSTVPNFGRYLLTISALMKMQMLGNLMGRVFG
jgi:hypothetical protein